jgi:hypothetical protein
MNRRFEPQSGRGNPEIGIKTEKTMKIHSALDAEGGVDKMETVTSLDRFQLRAKWEIPVEYEQSAVRKSWSTS